MSSPETLPTPPADPKRLYVAPTLVVHGDVQTLTQKQGPNADQDGGGSFDPGAADA